MTTSRIVTLLTDFGTRDPFAGVMKGVMLGVAPDLKLVDLTHEIEPQAVADAAFWLAQSYGWFPAGTVHLAVVDPGVGSERAPLALSAGGHFFVGPDNGIFELVARRARALEARELKPDRLGLTVPSRTFHGRDVFAPFAAALASGALAFGDVGPLRKPTRSELFVEPVSSSTGIEGAVVVVDRFGNLITNLPGEALTDRRRTKVSLCGKTLLIARTYADVPPGALAAVVGSGGMLEVFARDGSAAERLAAKRGTPVRVHG
jgi:S-adenosyl-L-methionine hydrolase (adenosine-forming)